MKKIKYLFWVANFISCATYAQINFTCSPPEKVKSILFSDYPSGDTLYISGLASGSFKIQHTRYHNVVTLVINGNRSDKKRITIDSNSISFKLTLDTLSGNWSINFDTSSYNFTYFLFVAQLKPFEQHFKQMMASGSDPALRSIQKDSIEKEIQSWDKENQLLWYTFFLSHAQSFLALDFVLSELQYSDMQKEKLKLIFDKLNPEFSEYLEWGHCKSFFETNLPKLNAGDIIPELELYDFENHPIQLGNLISSKNVYLLFWAGWCKGCITELSQLKSNRNLFDSLEIEIIPINISNNNDSILISKFNSYYLSGGVNNPGLRQLGMNALPFGVFTSKDRKLISTGHSLAEIMQKRVDK